MSEHMHNGSQSKSRTSNIVSYIFSFFLALDLLLIALLFILNSGVFSERSLISALDGKYYSYVQEYVESQANYYTLPTGINPDVLKGVFTLENIQINVNKCFTSAINNTEFKPDFTAERGKLLENVTASFAADGVTIAEGNEANAVAESYVNEIMEIYKSALEIPGLSAIARVQDVYSKMFPIAVILLVVLAIALLVVLLRLHHFLHRGMRYVAYATGGAALMITVAPACLQVSGYFNGLNLQPQYFYYFCVSTISRLLRLCLIGGAVFAVMTVVLVVICGVLRGNVQHHHRRR